MGLQQEDLRILGLHERPPVIRELRSVWLFIRNWPVIPIAILATVSYKHLREHETRHDIVSRLMLE